jgi:hypothetical protein
METGSSNTSVTINQTLSFVEKLIEWKRGSAYRDRAANFALSLL